MTSSFETQPIVVGIDVGGTKVALTAADRQGQLLSELTIPTLAHDEPPRQIIRRIADAVHQVQAQAGRPLAGIGIACPGPVDPLRGIAISAVNLGWQDVELRDELQKAGHFNVPIWLQNDVKAGALGEAIFGTAIGEPNFVYLAIGTGLAGGALIQGNPLNGATGCALEVGHISIDPHGPLCPCGLRGCVEMYLSGKGLMTGMKAHVAEHPESPWANRDFSTHDIIAAAREGDEASLAIIDRAGEVLGEVLKWCTIILNPSLIVIGGGMGHAAYDLLIDRALEAVKAGVLKQNFEALNIRKSIMESSALGPAAVAWHNLEQN